MIKQKIYTTFLCLFLAGPMYAQTSVNQYDSDGKRHGNWTKNFDGTKEKRYEGQFEHGKEIGLFKFYQMVGKKSKLAATKTFNPENSLADVKFYSLKGNVISEGVMDGKTYVGEWKYYHKNSDQLMTLENYNTLGDLNGARTVFYENGAKAETLNYVNGKLEGKSNYYSLEGTLVKSYHYENDQLHGPSKHYDGSGELVLEGDYKRGKKTGIWKYYNNGKLIDEKDFTYRPKFKKGQR